MTQVKTWFNISVIFYAIIIDRIGPITARKNFNVFYENWRLTEIKIINIWLSKAGGVKCAMSDYSGENVVLIYKILVSSVSHDTLPVDMTRRGQPPLRCHHDHSLYLSLLTFHILHVTGRLEGWKAGRQATHYILNSQLKWYLDRWVRRECWQREIICHSLKCPVVARTNPSSLYCYPPAPAATQKCD